VQWPKYREKRGGEEAKKLPSGRQMRSVTFRQNPGERRGGMLKGGGKTKKIRYLIKDGRGRYYPEQPKNPRSLHQFLEVGGFLCEREDLTKKSYWLEGGGGGKKMS